MSQDRNRESPRFPSLILAVREGLIAYHQEKAFVASITNIALSEHNCEMHIKPGHLSGSAEICVEVVTCYYDNPRRVCRRDGAILLTNRTDGRMTAILADAGLITDMRTAGSSAVAEDALASPGEITLALVGAGTQAYWHAATIAAVRSVAHARVWARDVGKAEASARRIRHELSLQARVARLDDAALALVVTATPAQVPILTKQILSPESVVVGMGATPLAGASSGGRFCLKREHSSSTVSVKVGSYGELQWLDPGSAAACH